MFSGFPPEALKFLRDLARHNHREWFQPRKEIFETKLKAPMTELVEAINSQLPAFAPEHITDPKQAVFRIYRDTRFSHDKTPYKTQLAASFPRRGTGRHSSAGFYIHLSPKSFGVGAGIYMPATLELYAVRTWLSRHHEEFLKVSRRVEKVMGPVQGESLSRAPKGFDPKHPACDLIRMKSWFYWSDLDAALAETPKLFPDIMKRFRAMAPAIEMLNAGLAVKGGKPAAAGFEL